MRWSGAENGKKTSQPTFYLDRYRLPRTVPLTQTLLTLLSRTVIYLFFCFRRRSKAATHLVMKYMHAQLIQNKRSWCKEEKVQRMRWKLCCYEGVFSRAFWHHLVCVSARRSHSDCLCSYSVPLFLFLWPLTLLMHHYSSFTLTGLSLDGFLLL